MMITDDQRRALDEDGYLHVAGVLSPEAVEELRARLEALWAEEGAAAGEENYHEAGARRLANLAGKNPAFQSLWAHPLVIAAATHVMGPSIHVTMVNARDALPRQEGGERQGFHADTDSGGLPDETGYWSCTAIWPLDPFTEASGATLLIPGSHRTGRVAKEVLDDLRAPHPDEVMLLAVPGDLIFFNGHCWHAGGPNRTDAPRRAVLVHYFRADIPRSDDRRQHLDAAARAALDTGAIALLGLDD